MYKLLLRALGYLVDSKFLIHLCMGEGFSVVDSLLLKRPVQCSLQQTAMPRKYFSLLCPMCGARIRPCFVHAGSGPQECGPTNPTPEDQRNPLRNSFWFYAWAVAFLCSWRTHATDFISRPCGVLFVCAHGACSCLGATIGKIGMTRW